MVLEQSLHIVYLTFSQTDHSLSMFVQSEFNHEVLMWSTLILYRDNLILWYYLILEREFESGSEGIHWVDYCYERKTCVCVTGRG